jgi:hypothetical protein
VRPGREQSKESTREKKRAKRASHTLGVCEIMKKQGNEIALEPLPGSLNFLDAIARILDADFFEAAREQMDASERPDLE